MSLKGRSNSDASARDRLIAAGEALFASRGFGAVSLRQVCAAAGARNNFAIQYHFGDLEGFATAIVQQRAGVYEARRAELLAQAEVRGPLTPLAVLQILQQPIIEQVDDTGEPIGSRFMVALQSTPWGWRPLSDQLTVSPVTQQLIGTLESLIPQLPPAVLWQRLYLASLMIVHCAAQVPRQSSPSFRVAVIRNVFEMAAAALSAPLDEEVANDMTDAATRFIT